MLSNLEVFLVLKFFGKRKKRIPHVLAIVLHFIFMSISNNTYIYTSSLCGCSQSYEIIRRMYIYDATIRSNINAQTAKFAGK